MSKCCSSCSFCTFTRAASKEGCRSHSICEQNKSCQRCSLCKSIVFCPICSKCPTCCHRDQCWGKASELLASLAKVGFKSQSGFGVERRVQSPFQGKATSQPLSLDCEQICKSRQEQGPFRSSGLPHSQESHGKSGCPVIPGLLQPSFASSQTQQKWRLILDLSTLNLFLETKTFKMETPETIRLSLQQGEWVTLMDFSYAYFHIPITRRSRKYLRFHLNKVTYQFKALPFGLATARLEFTKVVKEVKLTTQARGIRIHQYLDDWLLRAQCPATCLQHTWTLLDLCQDLGWVVNMKKSELTPQQVFNLVGYRFDLRAGRVLPTQDRWSALKEKFL